MLSGKYVGRLSLVQLVLAVNALTFTYPLCVLAAENSPGARAMQDRPSLRKRINFVATKGKERTANPPGWEEYDGSAYTKERGYGWLDDLSGSAWDGGGAREMILPNGTRASPKDVGRLELANGHASHTGNRPVVLRIDLPDGWYRVACSSVYPGWPLPLVDERTIKLRAHDVVFTGPMYGAPLRTEGNRLIEGSGTVEVTDGHLRIVMGDPAYGGWTWSYRGPLWTGWRSWWEHPSVFAKSWYQKITRTVDPGFHGVRINSLEVEGIKAPAKIPPLLFRDFFNREDSPDINSGVADADRWREVNIHPAISAHIKTELYKTSLKLMGPRTGRTVAGVLQKKVSPENGLIRYATRVSLFTGEGSKIHSGAQEAGLVILGEPAGVTEFNSTFIGVAFDRSRADTPGWVRYRVGDGSNGYRTDLAIPDTSLPFRITEGEYEIIVDHDVTNRFIQRVQINGTDITERFTPGDRKQRVPRGIFGIRSSMDPLGSGVDLRQFFWYYRVQDIS